MRQGLHYFIVQTEAGTASFSFTERGLHSFFLPGEKLKTGEGKIKTTPAWLLPFCRELEEYFSGCPVIFTCPIDYWGYQPFTRRVLEIAGKIPYGQVCSYRRLAETAGSPKAARAVGQALATNRTPLVIPCHRVVREDGGLGGYSVGLAWKERLLSMEKARKAE